MSRYVICHSLTHARTCISTHALLHLRHSLLPTLALGQRPLTPPPLAPVSFASSPPPHSVSGGSLHQSVAPHPLHPRHSGPFLSPRARAAALHLPPRPPPPPSNVDLQG
eukprot:scaffold7005_cov28-Tisochrysis_lutea.AAC.1